MKNYKVLRILWILFYDAFLFIGTNSIAQDLPDDIHKDKRIINQYDSSYKKIGPLLRKDLEAISRELNKGHGA